MESALEGIEDQLKSDGVQLTLEILKNAKRFHATVSFIADIGLKEATDKGCFCLSILVYLNPVNHPIGK